MIKNFIFLIFLAPGWREVRESYWNSVLKKINLSAPIPIIKTIELVSNYRN
jgi:hypothetical protein